MHFLPSILFIGVALGAGFVGWNFTEPAVVLPQPNIVKLPIAEEVKKAQPVLKQIQDLAWKDLAWKDLLEFCLEHRNDTNAQAMEALKACASQANTADRFHALAAKASLLKLPPSCMRVIAAELGQHPAAVAKRVVQSWTSQSGAESLYSLLPAEVKQAMANDASFLTAVFGSRADAHINAIPTPSSHQEALKRIDALLRNNALTAQSKGGAFGSAIPTKALQSLLAALQPDDHPALIKFFENNWSQIARNDRLPVFSMLGKSVHPDALHDMVRSVVRSTASDRILMEYGASFDKNDVNVDSFMKELHSWPSELSRRELIKGYLRNKSRLSAAEADLIAASIDDQGVIGELYKRVRQ